MGRTKQSQDGVEGLRNILKQQGVWPSILNEIYRIKPDNLWLTGNFYFGTDGLTWSYPPGELAVDAIGEPTVTIAYDDIRPYAADASPLRRF